MDANGVQIMDAKTVTPEFELPTGQEMWQEPRSVVLSMNSCSGALKKKSRLDTLRRLLEQVQAEPAVKARIKLEAILAFYETPWGSCFKEASSPPRSSLCHAEERSSQWCDLS